ncbi:hypothetical protein F4814DRAFT_412782 [Daldinia grandis]|nr:hypothetical protein F4814DRAFT_412782 [Daldinia grandis]
MNRYLTLSFVAASALALAQEIPDPLICEDTLDGSPPFQADSVPCLLRCQDVRWCMYWCADGLGDIVEATACVPSLEFGAVSTAVEDGGTVTFRPVSQGLEWRSWYETQTVMPATSSSSHTFTAPYRVTPASLSQSTSSQGGQVTQMPTLGSGSVVSTESAQSTRTETETETETGGEAVASPTSTAAAGHLSQAGLLGILGVVGCLIVMVAYV